MSLLHTDPADFHEPGRVSARAGLVAELRTFLPADAVLEQEEEVRPYECDGLSAYRQLPLLVVLPRTLEEVQRIMRLCHERNVPVVARGAGTGLSGGALPLGDGILLSLARFTRILAIDPVNRTARVQPGVRNLAVSEAAAAHGLYYSPDPSSQIACTIGGNVAENSGGVHCLKYGLTIHNVLGIKFVTSEGELVELGGEILDSPGLDLLALMIGSEGMLGVEVGGTITGEHGVGIEKIGQMCVPFDKAELAQFHAVTDAFDAKGLLNQGKGVPTLRRCSEYRQLPDHRDRGQPQGPAPTTPWPAPVPRSTVP